MLLGLLLGSVWVRVAGQCQSSLVGVEAHFFRQGASRVPLGVLAGSSASTGAYGGGLSGGTCLGMRCGFLSRVASRALDYLSCSPAVLLLLVRFGGVGDGGLLVRAVFSQDVGGSCFRVLVSPSGWVLRCCGTLSFPVYPVLVSGCCNGFAAVLCQGCVGPV